jgi:hypothetical protein
MQAAIIIRGMVLILQLCVGQVFNLRADFLIGAYDSKKPKPVSD